ncbi:unnamed protein product, partial [marine sediment metagenome]
NKKPGAIYDIIITHPVSLHGVVIKGVNHPKCIPEKCDGVTETQAERMVQKVAKKEWKYQMGQSDEYKKMCERFPGLVGSKVSIFEPEDE